jgi:hypothetical protein
VGIVDAVELADRFGLGGAAKLSDGPVARGRQGEVWRLETADGRWAVKVPFHESGEDGAGLAHKPALTSSVPPPRAQSHHTPIMPLARERTLTLEHIFVRPHRAECHRPCGWVVTAAMRWAVSVKSGSITWAPA